MPIDETTPIVEWGPVDWLLENMHLDLLGGANHRERVTCSLATTRELEIPEGL
jgi:hypothetical protein